MLEAREACHRVFGGNLNVLLQDRDGLTDLIVAPGYDYQGFNDLFLRGVLAAFMDGRPALPTEPTDRALLHMAAYLAEREEIPLAEGITRAKVAEERYNDNQPIIEAFFKAGSLAYREKSNHQLAETSRRIRNNMIVGQVGDNRLSNITVYYLRAVIDGDAKSSPLGLVPRFSGEYENDIWLKHNPQGTAYINGVIDGTTVILFWNIDRVDAVNFLSADEARAFPGFDKIPDDDLAKLDSVLNHFPR
jgi:hypothetical protein